jgi:alpha-tubulin suppressor-like RCC1 family protein
LNLNLLGLGDRGQLGLGSRVLTAETFESVPNLPKRLLAIAAGEAHTVVLGARGDMYVFGDGKHGKLGPATHSNEFEPCSVELQKVTKISEVCFLFLQPNKSHDFFFLRRNTFSYATSKKSSTK